MAKRRINFKCPFCRKGDIVADYFSSEVRLNKGTWGGSKPGIIRSAENLYVLSEKCPVCGKSSKEIKSAYENGVEKSHQERLERIQATGMPTKIVSYRRQDE